MVQTLKNLPLQTRIILIVLAAALVGCVAMMAVSPARSALTYFSGEYVAEIQQTHIGVALTEGTGDREDALVPEGGALIADAQALLKRPTAEAPDNVDKYMVPGEVYSERLSVQNRSSDMDEYVRLTVRKYWATEVYYYKAPLPAGEAAEYPAITGISIDPSIKEAREDYSNCWLALEAQVDSVQVNNAHDAAKSAWGVDVSELGLNWSQED